MDRLEARLWLVVWMLSRHTLSGSTTPSSSGEVAEDATTQVWTSTAVPHVHQGARWGPYFEDGPHDANVTARVGSTVTLDCRIALLHDKTVTWLRRVGDAMRLLTVGRQSYSADQRVSLSYRYPGNWRLRISPVTTRDDGAYVCQVATHPPRARRIFLAVTAPEVRVEDEEQRAVEERYYRAGSAVQLTCVATRLVTGDTVSWARPHTLPPGDDVSVNTSESPGKYQVTLSIARAQRMHSGNYTCAVDDTSSATVAVHILNGELPAAVHGGNTGGSLRAARGELTLFAPLLLFFLLR